ncbi:MAG TPA: endonuclease/exonuclease/phosphatase family protein [Gemmatimonadales bacterium]
MNKNITLVLGLAIAVAMSACRAVLNYPSALGPRYAGSPAVFSVAGPAPITASSPRATIRVVTYNVQWGKHIDRAINVLTTRAPLPNADIVVLQEMDADGTRRIADALGMYWIYYPAVVHPRAGHDMGNAVLSRWPIVADEKLMLPHIAGLRHAQRIATAATVMVGDVKVRVYSAHLGTPSDIRPSKRRDQARTIVADAAAYPLVIVAGDMNSHGIGKEFVANGFVWPTEHNGFTTAIFNWDHVFLKGFSAPAADQKFAGIVRDTLGTSDHDPVWAVAQLP